MALNPRDTLVYEALCHTVRLVYDLMVGPFECRELLAGTVDLVVELFGSFVACNLWEGQNGEEEPTFISKKRTLSAVP